MLQELSMVEQRYQAVREVLDSGASISEVALRFGVNRRTLHRWLRRYATGGLGALADRSSKPDRCPHQIPAEIEARIVELRRSPVALLAGRARGEPILVGESLDGTLIALEGHKRLTAYLLEPTTISDGIDSIVGVSPGVARWDKLLAEAR